MPMLSAESRKEIIELIQREVVPAMGCTEPVAVSLCTAKAVETLGREPEKIEVFLSPNVLKNAMGVGIPGTGMIGLPIAIALGAIVGKSSYQLEVLKDVTPEAVERGKRMIEEGRVRVDMKKEECDTLYIEAQASAGGESATAIIAGAHTNFVYIAKGDAVEVDNRRSTSEFSEKKSVDLTLRKVWDFATTTPIEEIRFILESRRLNKAAADESLRGSWGHCLGRTVKESGGSRQIMGDTILSHMIYYTSAACDARMGGAKMPVMSNSGSGNQGIVSTLPVVVYAEDTYATEDQLIRALILSHLTVIYIKQSLGRLSALCGCVVASTGSSCGITYLMGGDYREVAMAVKNMVATLTGMICDGAKPSCVLKLSSAVSTAVMAATMAMEQRCVTAYEGIVDDDVDKSILNLTTIGSRGMLETDKMILHIMTNK